MGEKQAEKDAIRRVNPAMRHDDPKNAREKEPGERADGEQVHPTQGEPLRPLDPGGIGG